MTEATSLRQEDRYSHLIKITPKSNKRSFFIPVIDVRDGEEQREAAKNMLKASNILRGSKYLKPTYTMFGENYNSPSIFHQMKQEDASHA